MYENKFYSDKQCHKLYGELVLYSDASTPVCRAEHRSF